MRKKIEEDPPPSAPFWMLTYSDMVTLMLTFFVLLVSFSNMDETKFGSAANSLKGAFGVMEKFPSAIQTRGISMSDAGEKFEKEVRDNIDQLKKAAGKMGMEDQIQIKYTSSGLLIRMGDKVMFDVGKAELKPSAYPLLDIIGEMVRDKAKEVLVSGHTDNVPINTPLYPSNWELSLARAMVVVRYMMNNANVAPEKLVPTGYAEYRPVAPNTTDESRQFNRRVEFLVTWKKTEFLK